MHDYLLYYSPTCGYCRKVINYMQQEGIRLPMRSVLEDGAAEELVSAGGKYQVPCLLIDGKAMYESDDIIAYLKQAF